MGRKCAFSGSLAGQFRIQSAEKKPPSAGCKSARTKRRAGDFSVIEAVFAPYAVLPGQKDALNVSRAVSGRVVGLIDARQKVSSALAPAAGLFPDNRLFPQIRACVSKERVFQVSPPAAPKGTGEKTRPKARQDCRA
jgi:hypothetical protein